MHRQKVQLSDPWTWPRNYRRIYIATLLVSAPMHFIAVIVAGLLLITLVIVVTIIGMPLGWVIEKISNARHELSYQWNAE